MGRNKHSEITAGTVFRSKKGEVIEVLSIAKYENYNYYYECMSLETGEVKAIQYSNLKNGNFTFEAKIKYTDKELHQKASMIYTHINERINNVRSYSDVTNEFESIKSIYQFLHHYLCENNHLREPFLKGELEIDKDLKSTIAILEGYGKFKKYSPETCILVTRQENNSLIKEAIKSKDLKKMKALLELIKINRKAVYR
jgi:hypothetical protein